MKTIIEVRNNTLKEWSFGRQLKNLVKGINHRGTRVEKITLETNDTLWVYYPETQTEK